MSYKMEVSYNKVIPKIHTYFYVFLSCEALIKLASGNSDEIFDKLSILDRTSHCAPWIGGAHRKRRKRQPEGNKLVSQDLGADKFVG